jgi:hypothetical protein
MAYTPENPARVADTAIGSGSLNAGHHVPELISSNAAWKKATEAKGTQVACGTGGDGTVYRCPIDATPKENVGTTLGQNWDEAYKNKDFSQSNADIANAARDAYAAGGMAGVKQLEKDINAAAQTPGFGIAFVPDGADKMKILNGSYVSDKRQLASYAAQMSLNKEKELNEQGIYRVNGGFFKTLPDSTESFKLK